MRVPVLLKRAAVQALAHDVLNLGQSAAYSAMLALFPALIVAAAGMAVLPDVTGLRGQIGYFRAGSAAGACVSVGEKLFCGNGTAYAADTGDGFVCEFAGGLERDGNADGRTGTGGADAPARVPGGAAVQGRWSFWQARGRALVLAVAALVPLLVATTLVMFGQYVSLWVGAYLPVGGAWRVSGGGAAGCGGRWLWLAWRA